MNLTASLKRSPVARSLLAGPIAIRRSYRRWRTAGVRTLLLRVETLVVSDVVLHVDEFEGDFEISPRSHLLHRLLEGGVYEPELVALFLQHLPADGDVIDIGANIGFFSVLAAKKLEGRGKILAVEPTKAAFTRLTRNLERNGATGAVIAQKVLVGASEGSAAINIVQGREEYSSIGNVIHPSVAGELTESEDVPMHTLDALIQQFGLRPKLVKVDVEGAEALVFAGATKMLAEDRPVIIAEFSPALLARNGSSAENLLTLFASNGYRVVDANNPLHTARADMTGDILALPN